MAKEGKGEAGSPRQLALTTLCAVHRGAYADVALERSLRASALMERDRRFVTELVYGCVRRQRSLDALITQLGKKPAHQQPPILREILHLGLYQLRYLDQVPDSAAVSTTVELAKNNGLAGLAGLVNGLLRQYLRLTIQGDPLVLPPDPVSALGTLHSFPDWIIAGWLEQLGKAETEQLCEWFNQPPSIDLRVNLLKSTPEAVAEELAAAGIKIEPIPGLPQGLRFLEPAGAIQNLPGFAAGWWTVQDASAQLVSYLLDPQPGETIIDACAAPGGKTTHIAELMQDQGIVWACDRTPSRLKKLQQNQQRLGLQSIRIHTGDSRNLPDFAGQSDRALIDAPCSGLGTLHRHADARWRQTPDTVAELSQLQTELLTQAATWVKSGGVLVYATCTLNPTENEAVIEDFLKRHPDWQIQMPEPGAIAAPFAAPEGWVKVWPHRHQMDGFFMVKLKLN
jgi:16S rRNA (cytosine967-C5)-methyltransferase